MHKIFGHKLHSFWSLAAISLALLTVPLTASCQRMTEEQALQSIRQLTKGGKLPREALMRLVSQTLVEPPHGR